MKIIIIAFTSLLVCSGLQAQVYYPWDQIGQTMCQPGLSMVKRNFSHSYAFDHQSISTTGDLTGNQNFLLLASGTLLYLLNK